MRFPRPLIQLAFCLLVPLVASCSTTGGGGPSGGSGNAMEIRFTDFNSGQTMGVINDSWLQAEGYEGADYSQRRAAFYSRTTQEDAAGYKAAEDPTMAGLMEFLEEYDFSEYAVTGGPMGGDVRQAIEVIQNGSIRHIYGVPGMPKAQRDSFVDSVRGFVDVYNELPQYQAVQGSIEFSSPVPGR